MWRPPLYLMKPNLRNLFMKKFTRERVVPTISARVSCDILARTFWVSGKHVRDETVGKRVFRVEDAGHFLLFNHQQSGGRYCSRRADSNRLTREASFAEKIAGPQDRDHGFFADLIDYRKSDPAFLNIENVPSGIALREDCLLLVKVRNFTGDTGGIKKSLGVEGEPSLGFYLGLNGG